MISSPKLSVAIVSEPTNVNVADFVSVANTAEYDQVVQKVLYPFFLFFFVPFDCDE